MMVFSPQFVKVLAKRMEREEKKIDEYLSLHPCPTEEETQQKRIGLEFTAYMNAVGFGFILKEKDNVLLPLLRKT